MATVLTTTYGANTAIALDLSSLARSATWVAGVESTQIDNTSDMFINALVDVKGITLHATTDSVIGEELRVYIWGSDVSLATTPIDTLDGTTSAETITATTLAGLRMAASVAAVTVTTDALAHYIQPFAVAPFFGGIMPKFWGLFVSHNFQGSLGASNNALFQFTGIKYTNT